MPKKKLATSSTDGAAPRNKKAAPRKHSLPKKKSEIELQPPVASPVSEAVLLNPVVPDPIPPVQTSDQSASSTPSESASVPTIKPEPVAPSESTAVTPPPEQKTTPAGTVSNFGAPRRVVGVPLSQANLSSPSGSAPSMPAAVPAPIQEEKPAKPEDFSDGGRTKKMLMIFALLCVLSGGMFGARQLPCSMTASSGSWKFWSVAAPNLICTLDLSSDESVSGSDIWATAADFPNLQSLDLSHTTLEKVPAQINALSGLQTLRLRSNLLTTLPAEISSLTALKTLDLSDNQLQTLPASVTKLLALETLMISHTGIRKLPVSIANLATLRMLDLSGNELDALPPQVKTLSGLMALNLSGNPIPPSQYDKIRATLPKVTVTFSTGSTAGTVASAPGGTATSAKDKPDACPRNFNINGFVFCLPERWSPSADANKTSMKILNEKGTVVATVVCPMKQEDYAGWDITTTSRAYAKDGVKRGADFLTGQNKKGSEHMLIVLMHLHDLANWYGPAYKDVKSSCQIESLRPLEDDDIFSRMYQSVY